jgi:Xaa-Pro dipeptidase
MNTFAQHIDALQKYYEQSITLLAEKKIPIEAVLLHSGSENRYWVDDAPTPFVPNPHFNHWLPVEQADQMVLIQPGKKPVYFQVVPKSFWFDPEVQVDSWWADCFEIIELDKPDQILQHLGTLRRIAFVGENVGFASTMGLPSNLQNERNLTNRLDFNRSIKSDYEISCLRVANDMALHAHAAAKRTFDEFGSEWAIHAAYLEALEIIEPQLPYQNIVGLDEKSAILHYQHKRAQSGADSQVLLIDAGARYRRYASDLTRTYARENTHPVFVEVIARVEKQMLELCDLCTVGTPYQNIHEAALASCRDILVDLDIVRGSKDELNEKQIAKLFFPHGIGHSLGIQVHDISGHFLDETGVLAAPPEKFKHLRLTRKLDEGFVITIEPGLYFIPVLLNPERDTPKGKLLNWSLIDELIPLGGARFEDNVLVHADGPVNLTRP